MSSPGERKSQNRDITRRVTSLFRPHSKMVFATMGAVLVGVIAGLLPPIFIMKIIDEGITKGNLPLITEYSLWTVVATIFGAGFTLLYGYWSVMVGQKIMNELRRSLFLHLQGMSLRFFTSTRTGDIQTRLISDVQGVQTVLSGTLTDAISNIAIVISSLIAMFLIDWRLTLMSIALIPVFAFVGRYVGNFARDVRKGTQEQTGELNSMMQETLSVSGILLTKTSGKLDRLTAKFDRENVELSRWQIKAQLLQYMFFGMIRLITTLSPALVYWLAGYLISARGDHSITVGTIVAFTGLQTRLFFPITGLLSLQVEIMGSYALFERIFQYIDMPRDVQEKPEAKALIRDTAKGEVEFRNVFFRYEPEGDWNLDDVSFTAAPGQLVALVGPSGAGKTTLTYMIPRLYDVDDGAVLIDGVDIRDLTLESLGEAVGAVTQETYLLHASVKDNLLLAKPDATQEELEQACRMAAIHDHIAGLEEGYDTLVGERGYKLSGGEKQRLAIARAILKNPRILILDEATSALDTRSERLIQDSLKTLMAGRTTFAIAHRLSTILEADLILVLQSGNIVERGRHADLLAQNGLYARLYNEQFRSEQHAVEDA
jgi:ATP-binding cassette subfamily B protein